MKRNYVKVASILKSNDIELIDWWLKTLPIIISSSLRWKILKHSRNARYIVWLGGVEFEFFE